MYAERLFPCLHDLAVRSMHRYRADIVSQADGLVLEIGMGTGLNLGHYRAGSVRAVAGIEPSWGMLRRARRQDRRVPFPFWPCRAVGERLPFSDATFHAVVATLVFCTIPDPAAALAEIRRVLRPGGRLLFLEHVRSDRPRVARWQSRLTPVWRLLAVGCCLDRTTVATIREAGFAMERLDVGPMRPWAPSVVRELACGSAVR